MSVISQDKLHPVVILQRLSCEEMDDNVVSNDEEEFPIFRFNQRSSTIINSAKTKFRTKKLDEFFKSVPSKSSYEMRSLEEELIKAAEGVTIGDEKPMGIWDRKNEKLSQKLNRIVADESEVIPKFYPGDRIFDLKNMGIVYLHKECTFQSLPKLNTSFDHYLHALNLEGVKEVMFDGVTFLTEFKNITSKDYAIRLLFRMLSFPDDHILLLSCKNTLLSIFRGDPQLTKHIGVLELLDNLINIGLCAEKLSSIIDFVVSNQSNHCKEVDISECEDKIFPVQCLQHILDVHCVCLKYRCRTYSNTELSTLIIILCFIGLDVRLRNNTIIHDISRCVTSVLNCYSTDDWTIEMNKLAQRLLSAVSDYDNCLFILKLLPYSVRGCQLHRVASYFKLHWLVKLPIPDENIVDVTPGMVLNWTKINPLNSIDGLYWFYAVIAFLDCSVNVAVYRKFAPAFKELHCYAQKLSACFVECVDSPDITRTKGMLSLLSLKWNCFATMVPLHQTTLFCYLERNKSSQNLTSQNDSTSNSQN